jgi:hypothetical protein
VRPVAAQFRRSQAFGAGATAGIIGNPYAPQDTIEYYVGIYGDYQREGHAGEDIACPVGTPIYAPADGTVLYAGWVEDLPGTGPVRGWLLYWNFGGIVTVTQHDGWISVIAHQSDNNAVHAGMRVKEGQLIGKSGNTKTRTTTVAPHVHVEALVYMDYRTDVANGIIYGRVNPARYYGTSTITTQSSTTTKPKDWFDMASKDDLRKVIQEENPWGYKNAKLERDDAYALLRAARTGSVKAAASAAATNAQIAGLVGALKAVANGEKFDEAKLLAGIQAAAKAGAKEGSAEALGEGVDFDATVTVKKAG